ncbi:PadR family transcriptional regulator [Xanthomonas sacchari]|uniref:Transcription regulator PadR N-terminal domain-containing protein n=1 Tax=Xanthomonas sacchari TaxID=56458 RepID=A0ABT3DW83_9XANT|nr:MULTISPECIES: PadR family transcriptional regulator [Xanthomonas]MCW0372979.1 hypothetical protein [Xanthomonas sacchari]MCW0380818.1 hypothetical protein [Xanthomonas sacchari]MCW0399199.1 hypothetical protein [Xanthomonas sacchari]MCW0411592.1 hypothetical protein [Xanthomonas sacchari]MCW0420435.1 hypothetical protein [Xanthomonas sacchari]
MNSQLKKGALEMCVLALLAVESNYAYDLVAQLANHLDISEGTIYPLMRRLQNDDYVTTYLVEAAGSPARKYYKLTAAGEQELNRLRKEWLEFSGAVNSLLEETRT